MNINKQELKENELRRLLKNVRQIEQMIKDQPLKELKEPFQKGWEVYYKLRDDIARRKDVNLILEKLIMAYQPHKVTKSVKHVKMIRQGIKGYHVMRNGKKVYVSLGPDRLYLTEKEYNALDDTRKAWFSHDEVMSRYYGSKKYKVDLPDYWLVMRTRPNLMTHVKVIDGDLESECALMWQKIELEQKNNWGGKGQYPSGRKRMETRMAITKFLKGEDEEVSVDRAKNTYW